MKVFTFEIDIPKAESKSEREEREMLLKLSITEKVK